MCWTCKQINVYTKRALHSTNSGQVSGVTVESGSVTSRHIATESYKHVQYCMFTRYCGAPTHVWLHFSATCRLAVHACALPLRSAFSSSPLPFSYLTVALTLGRKPKCAERSCLRSLRISLSTALKGRNHILSKVIVVMCMRMPHLPAHFAVRFARSGNVLWWIAPHPSMLSV